MLSFIFLTALKDPRYKLTRYSEDELSVRLSNVTVHDEGIYKCFYYSTPFKSKMTTVEVLGEFSSCSILQEWNNKASSTPGLPFCIQLYSTEHSPSLSSALPNNTAHAAAHKTK